MELDAAFEAFQAIVDEYKGIPASDDAETETEARSRLIDRLLFECLGWPRSARQELTRDADRTDYLMKDEADRNWAIVEAKRPAHALANPTGEGKDGTRKFKLSGPALDFGSGGGAWSVYREQIVRYGAVHGTCIGIATNGNQWVGAAVPSRSGRGLEDEFAVVFADLNRIRRQFEQFYNFFSLDGVRLGFLENFLQETAWVSYRCLRPYFVERNPRPIATSGLGDDEYYRTISRALDVAFTPIEDDEHIVEHCFVESRESKDADDRLVRLTELLSEVVDPGTAEYEAELKDAGDVVQESLELAVPSAGALVLLSGELSSGKTTYIQRLHRHKLSVRQKSRVRFAHIRFDRAGDLSDVGSVGRWVADQLQDATFSGATSGTSQGQFFDLYRPEWEQRRALFGDATDRREFIAERLKLQRSEPVAYAQRLLGHTVRRHRRLPFVVFDGIDHLSAALQNEVLRIATTFQLNCYGFFTVILDDATVWRLLGDSNPSPFFDYCGTRVWLPRPKIGEVLNSRLKYLKSVFETTDSAASSGSVVRTSLGRSFQWVLSAEQVAKFLRDGMLLEDRDVRKWIEMLSNYNIREMLRLCKELILAPCLRKEKVFAAFATSSINAIGSGQIARALIRPRHRNYVARSNGWVYNVYSFRTSGLVAPLAPLMVLFALEDQRLLDHSNREEVRGFIRVDDLVAFCESLLRIPRQIVMEVLEWLRQSRMIQTYDPSEDAVRATSRIKIEARGRLHVEWALGDWNYMREMGEVDAIGDRQVFDQMMECSRKFHTPGIPTDAMTEASTQFANVYIGQLMAPYSKARITSSEHGHFSAHFLQLESKWCSRVA
ncbi:MAG: hypothetical protein GXP62_01135 [Oligoflexia bacterium]|nr:hypothetical protein [Oligoflexia bacterium]